MLTSPTFDYGSVNVPDHAVYTGPILDDPPWAEPFDVKWAHPDRRLVLVAFSSTLQDQAPLLQRIVDALSGQPVRALVTLGQMIAVVHAGAGVRLSPKSSPGRIAAAVRTVLEQRQHATAASTMARTIARERACVDVVAEVSALASAPEARPAEAHLREQTMSSAQSTSSSV